MSEKRTSYFGGIGLCGALFLVFLVLKLAEIGAVAHWSWWWVTAPLWIPWGLVLTFLAALAIVAGVVRLFRGKTVKL